MQLLYETYVQHSGECLTVGQRHIYVVVTGVSPPSPANHNCQHIAIRMSMVCNDLPMQWFNKKLHFLMDTK